MSKTLSIQLTSPTMIGAGLGLILVIGYLNLAAGLLGALLAYGCVTAYVSRRYGQLRESGRPVPAWLDFLERQRRYIANEDVQEMRRAD